MRFKLCDHAYHVVARWRDTGGRRWVEHECGKCRRIEREVVS